MRIFGQEISKGDIKRYFLGRAWNRYNKYCKHIHYKDEQSAILYPDKNKKPSDLFKAVVKNILKY